VRRLFEAKQRPPNDPLIVHVESIDDAAPLVQQLPMSARALAARFWPGPLTLVLERSARVPDEVSAGLPTVAIRVPSHPVARAILASARVPIAAPSANLFSRPSPTQAAHVLADLDGRIDLIVDAGPTQVGVESTVLDLSATPPVVLRPGAIDLAALRALVPDATARETHAASDEATPSPGMLAKHYSPRAPLTLYEGEGTAALAELAHEVRQRIEKGQTVAVLAFGEDERELRRIGARTVELGSETDPRAVAARLYAALREADASSPDSIVARTLTTEHALTPAIRDRLRRAAAGRIIRVSSSTSSTRPG
jgi:L-threonylcarbamoyladenylate synthase